MIARELYEKFKSLLNQYPIVTIMGPRQSGKTTFVKENCPNYAYVNLEDPTTRELIQADTTAFFKRYTEGLILDEIQKMPELLSFIQVIVDEKPDQVGLFILTGSHQLQLHEAISQSLAGRTAILTLLPLSVKELQQVLTPLPNVNELLLQGFYPRIYHKHLPPADVYRFYYQTYIERDIRQLIHLKDLNHFQKFIKLCAGRIGQVINYSNLSNEVGVSATTIQNWLSILEASYLIFQLKPYFENFGKRVIKSPKLYFTDVGLASFLLDIETTVQLERDPLRGNLFENMVIIEVLKHFYNAGKNAPLYYFRDQHGNEVDLLIKQGNQFIAIEIKAAMTFTRGFLKGLDYFKNVVGDRYSQGYVVYNGEQESILKDHKLIHFTNLTKELL